MSFKETYGPFTEPQIHFDIIGKGFPIIISFIAENERIAERGLGRPQFHIEQGQPVAVQGRIFGNKAFQNEPAALPQGGRFDNAVKLQFVVEPKLFEVEIDVKNIEVVKVQSARRGQLLGLFSAVRQLKCTAAQVQVFYKKPHGIRRGRRLGFRYQLSDGWLFRGRLPLVLVKFDIGAKNMERLHINVFPDHKSNSLMYASNRAISTSMVSPFAASGVRNCTLVSNRCFSLKTKGLPCLSTFTSLFCGAK